MIEDHLMPSGDSTPAPSRRDRNLEALGGSTRLELGLGGVMRVLRRRGLVLLAIFAISAGLIYLGSSQLPKRYASVTWIRVTDDKQNLFVKSGQNVDLTKEQRAVITTLESPGLSAALQKKFGPKFGDISSVAATGLEASPLIRIDSEASTPELAQQSADTAANYVVTFRAERQRAKLAARGNVKAELAKGFEATLNADVADLAGIPNPADPRRQALQTKINAATTDFTNTSNSANADLTDSRTADGGLEIYEDGIKPVDPAFPKPTSWAIIGGLAILLISVGVVYGREELAGRFRSGDSSESRRAGARVLGVLPTPRGTLPRGVVTGAGATVDEVGLQLVHLLGRSKPNVVMLCGVDGVAPESTARRVAQAIAESGARVVFAACRGVSEALDSDEFEAPVPRARLSVVHEQQTGGRLRVLDDGIAVNELTVARARTVLRRLTEQCEYVVIAAPSPTIEPSSLVLAELADATVMIAQHGVTKLRDAERAGTRLRRVGGAVLGVLVDPAKPGPVSAAYVARAAGVSAG